MPKLDVKYMEGMLNAINKDVENEDYGTAIFKMRMFRDSIDNVIEKLKTWEKLKKEVV